MNESSSNECNSIEEIYKTNLSEQTKFRLSEIIGIEDYFHQEIDQRKLCSKNLNKYVTTFNYIDKILIVLMHQVVEYQLFRLQVLLQRQLE